MTTTTGKRAGATFGCIVVCATLYGWSPTFGQDPNAQDPNGPSRSAPLPQSPREPSPESFRILNQLQPSILDPGPPESKLQCVRLSVEVVPEAAVRAPYRISGTELEDRLRSGLKAKVPHLDIRQKIAFEKRALQAEQAR